MSTNWPNEYELTEEQFYEYEFTEKMSTSWPKRERIDLSTNWLENESTSHQQCRS